MHLRTSTKNSTKMINYKFLLANIRHSENHTSKQMTVKPTVQIMALDTITSKNDTAKIVLDSLVFENVVIEKIMQAIPYVFGIEVTFKKIETASPHRYYKLGILLPLNEVVEQLNTFEHINIIRNGNNLNID